MTTRWIKVESSNGAMSIAAQDFSAIELQVISETLRGMSIDTSFKVSSLINDLDNNNLFKGEKNVNKSNG